MCNSPLKSYIYGLKPLTKSVPVFSDQKEVAISMPHRYKVRYECEDQIIEFEVEVILGEFVLYRDNTKKISGAFKDTINEANGVEQWLRSNFKNIEVA